jgi:hypothetical protein
VVEYDISWTEVAGQLTAVGIGFFTIHDDLSRFGLTGGEVASDGTLAGCGASTCQISGYWVNTPEPGSLALLASAFGVWGVIGRYMGEKTPIFRGDESKGKGIAGIWKQPIRACRARAVRPCQREGGEDQRVGLRRVASAIGAGYIAARGGYEIPGDGSGRDALRRQQSECTGQQN